MAKIRRLQENWDRLGHIDPLWAVLTSRGKENRQWDVDEFFETGEREIKEVLDHLRLLRTAVAPSKALDFGCAVGRLTQALANRFDEVYGVDIAPSMIEHARRFNTHGDRCKYVLNEVDDLSAFETNYFDFVYSNITLQHMKPKYARKYLAEFVRILRPGGVMAFQLPSERLRGATRLKRVARCLVPENVIDWIFHARVRLIGALHGGPVMEMYGIRQNEVLDFLSATGAKVVGTQKVGQPDSVWLSYRYYAIKNEGEAVAGAVNR